MAKVKKLVNHVVDRSEDQLAVSLIKKTTTKTKQEVKDTINPKHMTIHLKNSPKEGFSSGEIILTRDFISSLHLKITSTFLDELPEEFAAEINLIGNNIYFFLEVETPYSLDSWDPISKFLNRDVQWDKNDNKLYLTIPLNKIPHRKHGNTIELDFPF